MKILVTGGTGLLGMDLCRRLSADHDLLGWARRVPSAGAKPPCRFESVDVTSEEAVRQGIGRFRPELVVHCAGMTDVDACERDPAAARLDNAAAVGRVASACSAAGAVLLAVSTDYVFDGNSPRPYLEGDAPGPISAYGKSKLEGEQLALELSPRVMVVRVSALFGAARRNFVSGAAQRLRAGEEVRAVTDQINSPSYTVDLAEGIARLILPLRGDLAASSLGGPLHGVFHLANRGGASRFRVAEKIAAVLGKPMGLVRAVRWEDLGNPAKRPAQTELDCSRFAERVGEWLRPWEEALRFFLSNSGEVSDGKPS